MKMVKEVLFSLIFSILTLNTHVYSMDNLNMDYKKPENTEKIQLAQIVQKVLEKNPDDTQKLVNYYKEDYKDIEIENINKEWLQNYLEKAVSKYSKRSSFLDFTEKMTDPIQIKLMLKILEKTPNLVIRLKKAKFWRTDLSKTSPKFFAYLQNVQEIIFKGCALNFEIIKILSKLPELKKISFCYTFPPNTPKSLNLLLSNANLEEIHFSEVDLSDCDFSVLSNEHDSSSLKHLSFWGCTLMEKDANNFPNFYDETTNTAISRIITGNLAISRIITGNFDELSMNAHVPELDITRRIITNNGVGFCPDNLCRPVMHKIKNELQPGKAILLIIKKTADCDETFKRFIFKKNFDGILSYSL